MLKRNLFAAVAVGSMLTVGGHAIAADKKVIAVSIPAADHGWTSGVVYHAQVAAKEINAAFPGVEVIVKTSPSAAAQVSALEDLTASRKIDALVILPYSSEELTTPVKTVKESGAFITVVDRGLNDPTIQDLYVAGDNIAVGKTTAKFLVDKLGGKGTSWCCAASRPSLTTNASRNSRTASRAAGSRLSIFNTPIGTATRRSS
jgi:ribose transport system substrate-binding protein